MITASARRIAALATAALAAPLLLTACTVSADVSAGPTTTKKTIAKTAEDGLEKNIGRRPKIDCGSGTVIVKEGKKLTCTLTDPETGTQYDTKITLENVHGKKFTVAAVVADTPKS